jgi:hypothetical protein
LRLGNDEIDFFQKVKSAFSGAMGKKRTVKMEVGGATEIVIQVFLTKSFSWKVNCLKASSPLHVGLLATLIWARTQL